jgi:hypothetical protein
MRNWTSGLPPFPLSEKVGSYDTAAESLLSDRGGSRRRVSCLDAAYLICVSRLRAY